ncbi:hypothetical protein [Streptomyces sp. NPDC046385]|uniref:hypothetical protein n=1 Tax=unclassified Streptomyces TaxID=2593676 RepID=UPI003403B69F
MNPTDHTAPANRVRTVFLRSVWGVGGLTALVSLLLVAGALSANTAAGESGRPAGVLGVIGLFLAGAFLAVGVLTRLVLGQDGRR